MNKTSPSSIGKNSSIQDANLTFKKNTLSKAEFVCLMALLASIGALSIDSVLPAFPTMIRDFGLPSFKEIQPVVAVYFFGFGFGQLIFGPLSDVYGRKKPIYWGFIIFIIGSLLSSFGTNYSIFLIGRFLQGIGGASPRIISLALIRDEYVENAMAQITSLIMTIFILVPAIAPSMGQAILLFFGWRTIFIVLLLICLITFVWFGLRQHETLPKENRLKLTKKEIGFGIKVTLSQSITIACILMSGLVFGIFIGYLGSVQQIFSLVFGVTDKFPLYFSSLALSIGVATFFNSKLVMKLGTRRLVFLAFLSMALISNLFAFFLILKQGPPDLWTFMIYMLITFFSVGFLFGNLNAMAMVPLGHVAGIGSAVLGFVQTSISVALGLYLGKFFYNDVMPLALSFGVVSLLCISILVIERKFSNQKEPLSIAEGT